MERPIYISGAHCLLGDRFEPTALLVENGRIARIDGPCPHGAVRLDGRGLKLLPGMVDVHGDAFERQIMPRSNVHFPMDMALADTDRQLAGNGITTAYHGLTISWEPGLRSVEAGRTFMGALAALLPLMSVDHRVQLRWETFAFNAMEDVAGWLSGPLKPALAFNDHTTATVRKLEKGTPDKLKDWAARTGLSQEDYTAMTLALYEQRDGVPGAIEAMAEAARKAGAMMLSHDDMTVPERAAYRALGVKVAEFPMSLEAAQDAVAHGEHVVLGAPNVVRGGSHTGALDAAASIREGLCTILASDYYYPAMLGAIMRLVREEAGSLAALWPLVAANPAEAMGLADRGRIFEGAQADLIALDEAEEGAFSLSATFARGRIVAGRGGFTARFENEKAAVPAF